MKITKLLNGGELHDHPNDVKTWWLNGKRHREDGPAIEYADGTKYWYINDHPHREDGPTIEAANGNKYWYINDIQIPCRTQEEFERLMRLKAFW
jgi:hypothetical protein